MAAEHTLLPMTWADAGYMAPELILLAMMALLIIVDLVLPRRFDRAVIGWLSLASLLGSAASLVWRLVERNSTDGGEQAKQTISILHDSYRMDDFGSMLKLLLLAATALIVLWSLGAMKQGASERVAHLGEYYYLLLPAAAGAMIMVSTGDLVTLYVGLELLSMSTYILVGLRSRSALTAQSAAFASAASSDGTGAQTYSAKPAEAAFKYVVTGGISSALILFGMSYIYGLTGSTNIGEIAFGLLQVKASFEELLIVAFFFLLAGFGIKIAAAPFHAWAPDVYDGAPTPISALLAVVTKTAAVAALLRLFYNLVYSAGGVHGKIGTTMFRAVLVIAACAMVVGTVSALGQRNVKRLLALSGVANAGYLLVPIGLSFYGVHTNNAAELYFYAAAYLFMNIGAFAVVSIVGGTGERVIELRAFEGLYYRAPWTAGAMIALVLSLAGLPVSGGFFGKLFILFGAASTHAYWLVAVMVATSVVSYAVYFGIVRQMFMRSSGSEAVKVPTATGAAIWLCTLATLALGVYPNGLMEAFEHVFTLAGDLFVYMQ
ncbi:NADH/Ubiquinone/plastoquinone (complex I) [Paenibacillus curdlanolyticus YK9]|uniref:NADH-quinone oxidoreductase subunit N n=1 Tax=Paenibacillus curdlanolyticus YK9 TaxID=717606 RepID=E0IEH7_9BACL|nr:NADH-quinone oxidoreductase subunit N [Paenibacillus curdlanolyticus]EFM09065.1 NADH/Ubiquinone/plastoquinone (complex I) [Paenibacillus curdlanolyticus YK9]